MTDAKPTTPQAETSSADAATGPSSEVEFHRVARSGQVPEGYVRRFYVNELECAVARLNGKAYATSNYCTHLDCLLSSGKLVDDGLGCSCHGSVFDLETGDPVYPPATEPIQVYPVREENGEVFVGVSEADVLSGGPRRRKPRQE
jgi:3-phenylpropionate/trans-cinnamate dioxygenase ferredoxin component